MDKIILYREVIKFSDKLGVAILLVDLQSRLNSLK